MLFAARSKSCEQTSVHSSIVPPNERIGPSGWGTGTHMMQQPGRFITEPSNLHPLQVTASPSSLELECLECSGWPGGGGGGKQGATPSAPLVAASLKTQIFAAGSPCCPCEQGFCNYANAALTVAERPNGREPEATQQHWRCCLSLAASLLQPPSLSLLCSYTERGWGAVTLPLVAGSSRETLLKTMMGLGWHIWNNQQFFTFHVECCRPCLEPAVASFSSKVTTKNQDLSVEWAHHNNNIHLHSCPQSNTITK